MRLSAENVINGRGFEIFVDTSMKMGVYKYYKMKPFLIMF